MIVVQFEIKNRRGIRGRTKSRLNNKGQEPKSGRFNDGSEKCFVTYKGETFEKCIILFLKTVRLNWWLMGCVCYCVGVV